MVTFIIVMLYLLDAALIVCIATFIGGLTGTAIARMHVKTMYGAEALVEHKKEFPWYKPWG